MGRRKKDQKYSEFTVKGFLRGQLVNRETGKIEGDSGWVQNKVTQEGITNLARLLGGVTGSYTVGYACLGTQNTIFDSTQTSLVGVTNSFQALATKTSTSGTCTLQVTCAFISSDMTTSCSVAAAGLFKSNSNNTLIAGQTFATSQWNTNQDFNLTYQIRFNTA